jgi:hypothetical protein
LPTSSRAGNPEIGRAKTAKGQQLRLAPLRGHVAA